MFIIFMFVLIVCWILGVVNVNFGLIMIKLELSNYLIFNLFVCNGIFFDNCLILVGFLWVLIICIFVFLFVKKLI